ncbi:tetratricopeptide repeat protein [Nitzschia inconspicua]|uniref:Tetratricopeptide repeat protein n=1 Tax=Nitzschia inconspicua TaxID=303405 RepID=A0A9K3KH43_9STRA|nr:tetratricopeptide repeat protein [Nitzschia inconspicua]
MSQISKPATGKKVETLESPAHSGKQSLTEGRSLKTGTMSLISVATARALQSISNQNNEGVVLFNQGNYGEAVQVFKNATNTSKTFLNRPPEQAQSVAASAELVMSMLVFPSSQMTRTCELRSDNDPTVYANTFEVLVSLVGVVEDSCGHLTKQRNAVGDGHCLLFSKLATVLIYNLALAYHAAAMVSRDSDTTTKRVYLSKARDLYSLAYSIPQGDQEKEIIDAALLPLFVMAILNNLGQCYAFLDDRNNSEACFELLLRTIIVFQQNFSGACNLGAFDDLLYNERSMACFLNNTLFLILRNPCVAPAA